MSGAQDMSRRAFPEALRRLVAPWWERRRAAALAAALEVGDTMVVFNDRRMPVEHLAGLAEQALEMADRLAQPA